MNQDDEEIKRLLRQLIQVGNEVKIEMSNIRRALDKIDATIQEGFYIDWSEEELESEEPH